MWRTVIAPNVQEKIVDIIAPSMISQTLELLYLGELRGQPSGDDTLSRKRTLKQTTIACVTSYISQLFEIASDITQV